LNLIIGVVRRLGATEGSHRYNARYDVDGDGVIDFNDLEIVLHAPSCRYGHHGPR